VAALSAGSPPAGWSNAIGKRGFRVQSISRDDLAIFSVAIRIASSCEATDSA